RRCHLSDRGSWRAAVERRRPPGAAVPFWRRGRSRDLRDGQHWCWRRRRQRRRRRARARRVGGGADRGGARRGRGLPQKGRGCM
ncbi:hypothetical protein MNEG_13820, partial [Monoraphidium neglectum]